MLHDICRSEKDHAAKGGQLIAGLGYPEVADIISSHMDLDLKDLDKINETTVVYLSDKLVSGARVVSLQERLNYKLDAYESETVRQSARERIARAVKIQEKIESALSLKLHCILGE